MLKKYLLLTLYCFNNLLIHDSTCISAPCFLTHSHDLKSKPKLFSTFRIGKEPTTVNSTLSYCGKMVSTDNNFKTLSININNAIKTRLD